MSDKQKQASRENGAKSHGPVTPEGKQKSSQNSLTHGLCARMILLPDESLVDFNRHRVHWMLQLRPMTGCEREAAERVVTTAWVVERYQRTESSMFAIAMEKHAGDPNAIGHGFYDMAENKRALDLLHRYATRAQRDFQHALKTFRELVAERKEAQERDGYINFDDFQRKWGMHPADANHSLNYYGEADDKLPNEPEPADISPPQAA